MKKLILPALFLGAIAFTSCKKDYTCSCTESGITIEYTMTESKKAAAAAICTGEGVGPITVAGQTQPQTTNNCTLK